MRFFKNPVELEKESLNLAMMKAVPYVKGIVLDIGCGQKPYAALFAKQVLSHIGMDIDRGNNKQVDVCADSLALPFKSWSVETVISNQAIEHVRSPEIFMAEASRVLKLKGILVLTAPQLWCLHEKPHDYYRFTRYALELLCGTNGLEVLLLEERYGAFIAIGQMLALMAYLPNSHARWRTHLARLVFGPAQIVSRRLDSMFYNPDLTLGYLLIARKRS